MNRKLAIGIFALVALAAGGFVVFYHATRGPTEEEFETVQEGMGRDDVIAILGTPTETEHEADRVWLHWRARDVHIVVAFGDDRVVAKTWFATGRETEHSRIRRWITGESRTFVTGIRR